MWYTHSYESCDGVGVLSHVEGWSVAVNYAGMLIQGSCPDVHGHLG